jgi:hypothetical protein
VQNNRERWIELAELAANEQDPELVEVIKEINFLLAQKQDRLANLQPPPADPKLLE